MGSITVIAIILFIFALSTSGIKADQPVTVPFKTSPCFLKPDPGVCFAYIIRYFWNQETKKCESFVWGGCGGVVPFKTLEECRKANCPLARCGNSEPGPIVCRATLPRWKYDEKTDNCIPFIYGGCGPFPPFETKEECLASACIKNRCKLAPEKGPCKAAIPKYFFNNEAKKCDEFLWGGCDGVVPFNSEEECKKSCI